MWLCNTIALEKDAGQVVIVLSRGFANKFWKHS